MLSNGERLAAWRKLHGLSQAEAAKRFGVSQGAWAAWETNKKHPDLDNALRLEPHTGGTIKAAEWPKRSRRKRAATAAASGSLPTDDEPHAKAG